MTNAKLHPKAWVAFLLTGLYTAADALCSIFVSVYLWINSHDLGVICRYYIALFVVTPIFFVLAGWLSRRGDRLHVYRIGLAMHALFYGVLLALQERAAEYDVHIGALLGMTWGMYWAGANTISYDVSTAGRKEFFVGILNAVTGLARLTAPPLGGYLITRAESPVDGYHRIFGLAVALYVIAIGFSFLMHRDEHRQPFRIRRALFPGRDQRDWRYVMLASASLAGTFEISNILLGLLMFIAVGSELSVGVYAAYQALVGIVASVYLGRVIRPETRGAYLKWSSLILAAGGIVFFVPISAESLIAFGFVRAFGMAMFGICHFSLRMDIIAASALDPTQRIEYLCAWEIPLAVGRVAMMAVLLVLADVFAANGLGIRIVLILLCVMRLVTYWLLAQTSPIRGRPVGEHQPPGESLR